LGKADGPGGKEMRKKTQFGALVLAGIGFVAMPGSGWAQKPRGAGNPAPNVNRPAQNAPQPHPNANRPPVNPNRAPQNANRPANRPPQNHAGPQGNFNNGARAGYAARPNLTPRQQLGVGAARPWVDRIAIFRQGSAKTSCRIAAPSRIYRLSSRARSANNSTSGTA